MGAGNVVAVGGGHGLARVLAALVGLGLEPTAIVTVADDGGSSGRLRRDLGIIAPGDLRMALLALARNDPLADALGHRFVRGELAGHALGNLMLVALAEQAGGDFLVALERAAALLDCAGRVLPSTTVPVTLRATAGGRELHGQVRVMAAPGRIDAVWLEPREPAPCGAAVEALANADVVVLGPGSLFTSVAVHLLVPGVATALAASPATTVYVANLTSQPGETTGLDATAHVAALLDRAPDLVLDVVLVHDGAPGAGPGAPLHGAVAHPRVRRVVAADLALRDGVDASGHDPKRLAAALSSFVGGVE